MMNSATFEPVFDENGTLVNLSHVQVKNDKRKAIKAMADLAATQETNDHEVLANGWTRKQKRILNLRAPDEAHQILHTQRWNSRKGEMQSNTSVILPFEALWELFEQVFDHSIRIDQITPSSEDVLSNAGREEENTGGRLFYTSAVVTITVHLENGSTRDYSGCGVAYDTVPDALLGNMSAINAARRTAEKGAISDAKREALSHMGRVFRRAYDDGSEILEQIRNLLLNQLQEINPAKTQVKAPVAKVVPIKSNDTVPAPQKKDTSTTKSEAKTNNKTKAEAVSAGESEDILNARLFIQETLAMADNETKSVIEDFLNESKAELEGALNTLNITYEDFVKECMDTAKDDEEHEREDTAPSDEHKLSVTRKTGENILKAYNTSFEQATTVETLKKILDANQDMAKELTPKQRAKLIKAFETHKERIDNKD